MLAPPRGLYPCQGLLSTPRRYLSDNSLTGTIPTQLGMLTALKYDMYAPATLLQDPLVWKTFLAYKEHLACAPPSFGAIRLPIFQLKGLHQMPTISILCMLAHPSDLYPCRSFLSTPRRYLQSNSLSGTIPTQLGELTALRSNMYAPARRRHPPFHLSASSVTPNADHLNPVYAGAPI